MSQFQTPANWNVTSTSTVFHVSSNDSFSFVTSYDSTEVRNTITALFVVVNFLLAITGAAYIKLKARNAIARGRGVSVKHLTPWLGLSDVAKYSWSMRGIPGGWLGALMLFSGSIGILHQFLTNTLVTPARVPTRCIFDWGHAIDPNIQSSNPDANDEGANLVYQSQLATLKNGGTKGVYKHLFADNEVQMFRPQAQDTLGAWHCTNVKNQTVPWTGSDTSSKSGAGVLYPWAFNQWFNTSAYIYRSGEGASTGTQVNDPTGHGVLKFINGFIIWSAPAQTDWRHLRASIVNGATTGLDRVLAMDFDCDLQFEGKLGVSNVPLILSGWADKAWGYQKSLATVEDSALWLELTLDAITTLSLFNDATGAENQKPPSTIGCVVDGTQVSFGILVILGLVILVFLGLLLATGYFFVISQRRLVKDGTILPFDLADWQLTTYRHYLGGRSGTLEELRDVVFRYDGTRDSLRIETQLRDPDNHPSMRTNHSAQHYERLNHGPVAYDPGRMQSGMYQPFQSLGKPTITTSTRFPSNTSPNTMNGSTVDVRFGEDGWPLYRYAE